MAHIFTHTLSIYVYIYDNKCKYFTGIYLLDHAVQLDDRVSVRD